MLKALTLNNFFSPVNLKSKSYSPRKGEINSSRFYLASVLIAINLLLLMSYIYGVNDYAAKGYEIKALQNKVNSLNEENKKLSLKISEANSMVSIQSGFLLANFVPVGTPKFLETNANQFTKR